MSARTLDPLPHTDAPEVPPGWLLGSPARAAAQWLIRRRYRVGVRHADRVPATGPVIIASNHIGLIDGPLLAIFAPRPVHVLTKIEMFDGGLGRFLLLAGQVPLDRYHYDVGAVRTAVRVLRAGRPLGVYPEARRGGGDFDQFKHGAAYLALVTGAPVVPVTMLGSREAGAHTDALPRPGARIELVFGRPFEVEPVPWPRTRALVTRTSHELEAAMRVELQAAMDETGMALPGPLPANEVERSA